MNKWSKPIQLRVLLDECVKNPNLLPPLSMSAYVVTQHAWSGQPTKKSHVLYVGGNSVNPDRFRTRIGDLVSDMLGFYGEKTGHHSGGKSLHLWCQQKTINPLDLHISWVTNATCFRCIEIDLFNEHIPALNKNTPSKCKVHA